MKCVPVTSFGPAWSSSSSETKPSLVAPTSSNRALSTFAVDLNFDLMVCSCKSLKTS